MDLMIKILVALAGLVFFIYGAHSYNKIQKANAAKLSHSANLKMVGLGYLMAIGGIMTIVALTLLLK